MAQTESHWKQFGLYFKGGPVGDESVTTTTAASTAVPNYGVTLLKSTADATYVLEAPLLGSRKTVIFASSYTQKVRTNGASINVNSTIDVISCQLDPTAVDYGCAVDLYGASTSVWYMTAGSLAASTDYTFAVADAT